MSKEKPSPYWPDRVSNIAAPKFAAPKGFTRQSTNADGVWPDDGTSAILFVPMGVKLMDGNKRMDATKPTCMIIGTLRAPVTLSNKDEEIDGQIGDVVGVFWKAGMEKNIANAYGVETWIAPLFDADGERVLRDVGRQQPMKCYDVRFSKSLTSAGKRLPVLEDNRKESRAAKTPFDDPRLAPVRPAPEPGAESEPDDNDIPF